MGKDTFSLADNSFSSNPQSQDVAQVLLWAEKYISLGYPVVFLSPNEKRPHPVLAPKGLKSALRTIEELQRIEVATQKDFGIGILPPKEVLVLDFDTIEAWKRFVAEYPEISEAPTQITPRGKHVFLRAPFWLNRFVGVGKVLGDGEVDIRGLEKAYVVAHPTRIGSGSYFWERELTQDLPEIPQGLMKKMLDRARGGAINATVFFEQLLDAFKERVKSEPAKAYDDWLDLIVFLRGELALESPQVAKQFFDRLTEEAVRAGIDKKEATSLLKWWSLYSSEDSPAQVPSYSRELAWKIVKELTPEKVSDDLPRLFSIADKAGLGEVEVEALIHQASKKIGVPKAVLKKEWEDYLKQPLPAGVDKATLEEARFLANSPDLLYRLGQTVAQLGVVGERENVLLIYLSLVSTLLENPVSLLIKGKPSSGKSFLVKKVLELIPEDRYYTLTAMSAKALIYSDVDLSHRSLILFEENALESEELLYIVRTLLSEGEIRYLVSEKTPQGKIRAREIQRRGPTSLITTATRGFIREDNETRAFSLYTDDSHEQTTRVIEELARSLEDGGKGVTNTEVWKTLFWSLPIAPKVRIPFATTLAKSLRLDGLPKDHTRLRRDFLRFMALIQSCALIHAKEEERASGEIVAKLEDYARAYHIAHEALGRSTKEMPPQVMHLLRGVQELGGEGVSIKSLTQHLGWAKRSVHKWKEVAEALGVIEVEKQGKEDRLRSVKHFGEHELNLTLLPKPDFLAKVLGARVSYIHPTTGEPIFL